MKTFDDHKMACTCHREGSGQDHLKLRQNTFNGTARVNFRFSKIIKGHIAIRQNGADQLLARSGPPVVCILQLIGLRRATLPWETMSRSSTQRRP